MGDARITVDTNILVYSIDVDSRERHEQLMQFLNDAADKI